MVLLEELPHFSLWHDSASACLYATWRGQHTASHTRAQYDLIHWYVQATGSIKLLHDSLQDEDGCQQLINWLVRDYFTALAQSGLRAVAWVLPRNTEALCAVVKVLAGLKQPLVDTFSDVEAAYQWLHRWPPAPAHLVAACTPLTATTFLALSLPEQLALAKQRGIPLEPRWEADFYVQSYLLNDVLRVEAAYYIHSGQLYRVRAYAVPSW